MPYRITIRLDVQIFFLIYADLGVSHGISREYVRMFLHPISISPAEPSYPVFICIYIHIRRGIYYHSFNLNVVAIRNPSGCLSRFWNRQTDNYLGSSDVDLGRKIEHCLFILVSFILVLITSYNQSSRVEHWYWIESMRGTLNRTDSRRD